MINILIGGDVCPVNRNLDYFKNGDVERIFNDLLPEFHNADLSMVNLECPLINRNTPIEKSGPVIGVESVCINGIKAAHIDILNLANNHIMDHGAEGLLNTLAVCKDESILTVGAGKDLASSGKLIVTEVNEIKIGILGMAEHEFSIATEYTPGANPLNIITCFRTIMSHKHEYDFLIVLVHAGAAAYPFPSPRLREISRFIAELGADAVICQHSHCPGAYERYKGSHIVYGQGNFIYDEDPNPDSLWNKGYLVKLTIADKDNHSMEIIPYIQSVKTPGVRKMVDDERALFIKELNEISSKLSDSSFIQQKWTEQCMKNKNEYLFQLLLGFMNNRLLRRIHKIFPFARYLYTRTHMTLVENLVRCETHREAIETIFSEERKRDSK